MKKVLGEVQGGLLEERDLKGYWREFEAVCARIAGRIELWQEV